MFSEKRIRERFDFFVDRNVTIDGDFKRALKSHEKKDVFIFNMFKELNMAIMKFSMKYRRKPSQKNVDEIIGSLVDNFIYRVKLHKDQNHMSIMERLTKEAEVQREKDLEKTLVTGEMTGQFEELKGAVEIAKS